MVLAKDNANSISPSKKDRRTKHTTCISALLFSKLSVKKVSQRETDDNGDFSEPVGIRQQGRNDVRMLSVNAYLLLLCRVSFWGLSP